MLYVETRMSALLTLSQEAFSKSRRMAEKTSNNVQKLATNYNLKTMVGNIRAKKTENETRKAGLLTREQNEIKRREGLTKQELKNEKNARLERVRKGLTSGSPSGSPPGSARSTTSTTSLFSAPQRNAELSSSPLSSARSNKSTSSMSSIFFAPGGKHRTRRHKKHAKRTRKH